MMPTRSILAAVLFLGFACSGPAPSRAGDTADFDPNLADMGSEIYLRRCASCHGVDATGNGPVAASLRIPPADLTRIAARRDGTFPKGEIARFIDGRFETGAHGTREMPVWGKRFGEDIPESSLSEEVSRGNIATLVDYLISIQQSE
jgi:mono/diheme cytochrome c family protein